MKHCRFYLKGKYLVYINVELPYIQKKADDRKNNKHRRETIFLIEFLYTMLLLQSITRNQKVDIKSINQC